MPKVLSEQDMFISSTAGTCVELKAGVPQVIPEFLASEACARGATRLKDDAPAPAPAVDADETVQASAEAPAKKSKQK